VGMDHGFRLGGLLLAAVAVKKFLDAHWRVAPTDEPLSLHLNEEDEAAPRSRTSTKQSAAPARWIPPRLAPARSRAVANRAAR
jgi:hypothetical protein